MFTDIAVFFYKYIFVDKHRDNFNRADNELLPLYILHPSLVIKNTANLRELVENLARDVIFVRRLTNTGSHRALQKTLQCKLCISILEI